MMTSDGAAAGASVGTGAASACPDVIGVAVGLKITPRVGVGVGASVAAAVMASDDPEESEPVDAGAAVVAGSAEPPQAAVSNRTTINGVRNNDFGN